MRILAFILGFQLLLSAFLPAQSQGSGPSGITPIPAQALAVPPQAQQGSSAGLSIQFTSGDEVTTLSSALEVVLFMTLLSLAPAIVMTMTSFTRIIIVLSFLKRAMSIQELPPAIVVTGFAVFLTVFVMTPVATDIYEQAYEPYVAKEVGFEIALERAGDRLGEFMLKQTRAADIQLILDISHTPRPKTIADTPFHVIVPSFILSEIKTAFQMGFVLFLPFLAIDLVISSILISMGMFTLPPIVVSTPLKILLFIMVDGWNLVVESLAFSFFNT